MGVTQAFTLAPPPVQLRRSASPAFKSAAEPTAGKHPTLINPDLSRHHYTHLVPMLTQSLYIYSLCHLTLSFFVNVTCFLERNLSYYFLST
jgi:hypothetical protein